MKKIDIKKLLIRIFAFILALFIIISILFSNSGFASGAIIPEDGGETIAMPAEYRSNFYLPSNMRGVLILPEREFALNEGDGVADVREQIDGVLENIAPLSLNTVIIGTSTDKNVYYNTDTNKTDALDSVGIAVESARSLGLNVYLIFDINTVIYANGGSERESINALITEVHKFVLKYGCDGVILDDYYASRSDESFHGYMSKGAGIGYDNWLYGSTAHYFKTAADVIRLTDNSVPVGIMLRDVWANYGEETESGSKTSAGFSAYYDGYADTLSFLTERLADFAVVDAPDALTVSNVEIPFDAITDYWGGVCKEANTPMYIIHHNEKIGGDSGPGWNTEDQLLRQLAYAKKDASYKGSVFNSFSGLLENKLGTTDTLKKFFDNEINEESLFEDLNMLAPKSLNYFTNDAIAVFQGTYDDNFDVYFNNEKIKLNEAGYFYIEQPLKVGQNSFSFKHKGKVITYGIERKVISLYSIDSSIENGKTLSIEGGTSVVISAVAYKGANVTAVLNGKTVKLTQEEAQLDDAELRASYAVFSGKYKVPDGIIEQVQNLGTITVTADFQGYTRSMIGADVKVNALPKPPPPPKDSWLLDQDSVGTGEVVGYIDAVRTESEAVTFVKLKNDYTLVYDAKTTGNTFNPDFCRLPEGTLDYYLSSSGNYFITESGKRFSADDAVLTDGYGIGENALDVVSCGTHGKYSSLNISLGKKTSYNIAAAGTEYYTAWGDDYNVKDFTARYIYITFDNVTSVTKLPSFEYNLVFSAGRWETVTVDGFMKFRLVLELRRPGVYAGNKSYYSGGILTIAFQVPSDSLSGMNIVIDPGHGIKDNGKLDPGAIGHAVEQEVNLAIAKKLKERLEAYGANVVRLPTESSYLYTKYRAANARQYDCDLFISIHANSATGNSAARGTEVWYYTPFSQPLASSISGSVAGYFQNNVYSDGGNMNRGAKYSYFWVTTEQDFPSVLVEVGFVTNYEDAMAMASEEHQDGIAKAIADGVRNYANRRG